MVASLFPLWQHSTMGGGGGGSSHHKQRQPEQTAQQQPRSRDETPSARLFQATAAAGNGNRSRRAAQPRVAPTETRPPTPTPRGTAHEDEASARESRTKESASGGGHDEKAGLGAFGPAVGLSVVAGVSMAGLLGGRLWAVACVCAWLVALSRRQRPEAPVAAGGDTAGSDGERVVVDVDSRDHKKLVVLSGLLERDRTKNKGRDGVSCPAYS